MKRLIIITFLTELIIFNLKAQETANTINNGIYYSKAHEVSFKGGFYQSFLILHLDSSKSCYSIYLAFDTAVLDIDLYAYLKKKSIFDFEYKSASYGEWKITSSHSIEIDIPDEFIWKCTVEHNKLICDRFYVTNTNKLSRIDEGLILHKFDPADKRPSDK